MELEEVKASVKELTAEERRKLAMYILELEKDHVQKTLGPQITEDLSSISQVLQDAYEKLKGVVNKI